jgi:carbon monoxide dehydrogenase subunit G
VTVVQGERRFAAPPERVFAVLTDPDVIASAMPAVRSHSVADEDHWQAKVRPPLPLAPSLTVRFEVLDRRPPEHAALHAHGGGVDCTSTFDLVADGNATSMRWRAELHLTGFLGRFGGAGLEAVAHRQAARTLDAIERALGG